MSRRAQWQAARRTAREGQSKRQRERAAHDKRLEDLVVRVLIAVVERDAAVAACERRAGDALWEMTENEGLTIREAAEWCGEQVTTREATRLRRLVDVPALERNVETGEATTDGASSSSVVAAFANGAVDGASPLGGAGAVKRTPLIAPDGLRVPAHLSASSLEGDGPTAGW